MISLSDEEFEALAQEVFEALPDQFQKDIENLRIIVENVPSNEILQKMRIRSASHLFGLYEGIPLNKRGTWYGMYPVSPDTITLFKSNIERGAQNRDELRERVRHVLVHEIAHYYGMNEEEVRAAGY